MTTPTQKTTTANPLLTGIFMMALVAFVVGMLHFAQDILKPLALAGMLAFLISPAVGRMERWTGKGCAAVIAVVMMSLALGTLGWFLSGQMADLANKLPNYKENITRKLHEIRIPSRFDTQRLSQTIDDLKKEIPSAHAESLAPPAAAPKKAPAREPPAQPSTPLASLQNFTRPLLNGIGVWLFVMVLVIFMLVQRRDLRLRFIRLMGEGHVTDAKHAIEEASTRVLRYLTMQVVVNASLGVFVATGLFLIGIPNASLWGVLAAVLRFIPYVGVWVAAAFPILVSFAVSPGWTGPLLALGLFAILEFLVGNMVEPVLYGSQTGVSSLALIMAAGFWFWLWGPLGLALSTPLTVCLVVIGRHVPRMEVFHILLGNDQDVPPRRLWGRRKQPETSVSP